MKISPRLAALLGAATLASGAYALGTQSDGQAVAARPAKSSQAPPAPPADDRRDLSGVASRLGVKEADLQAALESLRPADRPDPADHEDDFATSLAKELGVSKDKVDAALKRIRTAEEAEHTARRDAFTAALAKKLGISAAKVREVFGDFPGPGGPGGRDHGWPGGPDGDHGFRHP